MNEAKQIEKTKTLVIWIVIAISLVYLVIFWFPNATASEDIAMVGIFEPDEGMPLPYVLDMIKPADSLSGGLRNFIAYEYYFYGFPYFAYSAISIMPVKLIGPPEAQIPLVMTLLRQLVSVVPMLLAIILLVYMQTGFRTVSRSVILLLVMLVVPAVTRNNFWWHPDGISILLTVLTIFFLYKDNLSFGKFFFLAALICGFSTGVKQTGVFFFLTIAVYLLWGLLRKQINFKKMVLLGIAFIVIMFVGFIISNPLLLLSGPRERIIMIWNKNRVDISQGYQVFYARGIRAAGPTLTSFFGNWVYLALASIAPVVGIVRNRNRLLNVIILSWSFLIGGYVLFFSLVKFQYVLPFALPLFSCFGEYIPSYEDVKQIFSDSGVRKKIWPILSLIASVVITLQFFNHVQWDISQYQQRTHRQATSPSIQFYEKAKVPLASLVSKKLNVYRDVRLYVPDDSSWNIIFSFELLDYAYFEKNDPEVILLMQQRLRDYLNPNVVGINPEQLERAREFYRDADEGAVLGYTMVFRDDFGLAFVRDDIYQENFE